MAIPLPKVIPDTMAGGGVVTSMRGGNALAQDMLDTQIKGSQAQYAPWTNYADAASKLAYAQFVGPQSIAAILTNPNSRGMFTREQYNQLANSFANQLQNPATSMAQMPTPSPRGDGMLSSIVNYLKNLGSGFQPPQSTNPMASLGSPSVPQASPTAADSGYSYDAQGNNVVATPKQVDQVITGGQGLPTVPPTASGGLPGGSPTYSRMSSTIP